MACARNGSGYRAGSLHPLPATTLSRPAPWRDFLILLLVCAAAFWLQLGKLGLIDPDEPFYALTAREMVASGDWLTKFRKGARYGVGKIQEWIRTGPETS